MISLMKEVTNSVLGPIMLLDMIDDSNWSKDTTEEQNRTANYRLLPECATSLSERWYV